MLTSYCVGPSGLPNRIGAVRDELAVGEEYRVAAQTRPSRLGAGLGNLVLLGEQVEVLVDQSIDRLVQGQPIGRPHGRLFFLG